MISFSDDECAWQRSLRKNINDVSYVHTCCLNVYQHILGVYARLTNEVIPVSGITSHAYRLFMCTEVWGNVRDKTWLGSTFRRLQKCSLQYFEVRIFPESIYRELVRGIHTINSEVMQFSVMQWMLLLYLKNTKYQVFYSSWFSHKPQISSATNAACKGNSNVTFGILLTAMNSGRARPSQFFCEGPWTGASAENVSRQITDLHRGQ